MDLLETQGLCKSFGGVTAVNNISLEVREKEILGLIGPNGSGKTTFINLLTGIYRPDQGTIRFAGQDITSLPAHQVTRRGLARTFQNLRVFPNVTVLTNILIGQHSRLETTLLTLFLHPLATRRSEKEAEARAGAILDMANLSNRSKELAKNLPYGEQRLLEICRALASSPRLLLLDEPCAGMNPAERDILAGFIVRLRGLGHTIFIVEHNMPFIMSLADRIVVLDAGRKFKEGLPADIQADEDVQAIYLGKEDDF
ncbi:MAG: ABC transporter ATP-binding protein [Thermodesulfobacteriota bacterium]